MNKRIKKLWIKALRSGEYRQRFGQLRTLNNGFCVFGVLCNLHALEHPEIAATQRNKTSYLGCREYLPGEVEDWADFNPQAYLNLGSDRYPHSTRALKIQLSGRKLRFDGVSEVEPSELTRFLLLGVPPTKLRVTEETEEVRTLNEQVDDADRVLVVNDQDIEVDLTWQLPREYAELDVQMHILNLFFSEDKQLELRYSFEEFDQAIDRIAAELKEVEERGLEDFFRTVIYILDQLRAHNVVWGVGRGSSCASYLLFLLGLHVVDCVTMNVPLDEFYHD